MSTNPLFISLRDIILQDSFSIDDPYDVSELIGVACDELHSGTSSNSRSCAYQFLSRLSFLPAGKMELVRLGKAGGLLEAIAIRVFQGWAKCRRIHPSANESSVFSMTIQSLARPLLFLLALPNTRTHFDSISFTMAFPLWFQGSMPSMHLAVKLHHSMDTLRYVHLL
jgi:hypothetical protein